MVDKKQFIEETIVTFENSKTYLQHQIIMNS